MEKKLSNLWFDNEEIALILNNYTNEINDFIKCCINRNVDRQQKANVAKHIEEAIRYWCGNLYPGVRLNEKNITAYNNFYNSLYLLLTYVVNGKIKVSKKRQQECNKYLYSGKIYRFLGYRNINKSLQFEDISYDGLNASWSKNPVLESVENNFIGVYYRFNATAGKLSKKAIDLEAMNFCKEGEVIFPFSRELIDDCVKMEWISVRGEEE